MTECPELVAPLFNTKIAAEMLNIAAASIMSSPQFQQIAHNLPESEIAYAQSMGSEHTADSLRAIISFNRLMNQACNKCVDKSTKLKACARCGLAFYCSQQCQKADWEKHSKWCCNQSSERDGWPMGQVYAKVKGVKKK